MDADGTCLLTSKPFRPGSRCRVTFDLPTGGQITNVSVMVKVAYSSYSGPHAFKVGTFFTAIQNDDVSAIREFVA